MADEPDVALLAGFIAGKIGTPSGGEVLYRAKALEHPLVIEQVTTGQLYRVTVEPYVEQERRYEGPIEVGQTFIWEPDQPHAWALVKVEEAKLDQPEPVVLARIVDGRDKGKSYFNDEDRFREACWQGPIKEAADVE